MTEPSWLDKAIHELGPIDSEPMLGMQAYLVNGKMFAAIGDQGVLVKLAPEQRRPEMVGEWLTLTSEALEDLEAVLALVRQSFNYVRTAPAPPKPPREERRFRKRQY